MKTTRAFTLIELVIVIVLIGILSATGSLLLRQTFKGYFTGENITDLANKTNIATSNLMRELKSAETISVIGANTLTFVNQLGQTVVIDLSGTTLRRSVNGAGAQTLCTQVISVAFAYVDQAFATTAVANNVRFLTMQLVASTNDGLPYSLMAGTVLRKTLP